MQSFRSLAIGMSLVSSAFLLPGLRPGVEDHQRHDEYSGVRLDPEVVRALGIPTASQQISSRTPGVPGSPSSLTSGVPEILNAKGPLSAALMTTVGGRGTQFSDVALLADWDGREDCVADHSAQVDDFSFIEPEIDFALTRVAISEHTFANGFTENIFYYGDSTGNVWVGLDTTGDGMVEDVLQINLPTTLNAFGTLLSDDQIVITGLGVNPVADLSSFATVDGAYCTFAGQVGEILYVSYMDTGGGLRLASNNVVVKSGVLAIPIADMVSPGPATMACPVPGSVVVVSPPGFPVTVATPFAVAFSVFHNLAGLAVDDDGGVYFHQVDLNQLTAGNIVKIADAGPDRDRSLAVNGVLTITTLNPSNGQYGPTFGSSAHVNRFTNFSGTSPLFGNVVSLATGPNNILYAAVAKSNTGLGDVTEGLFSAPAAFGPAGTPSMVISFADCAGAFDACSGTTVNGINVRGILPTANGFADVAAAGLPLMPGVNNFLVYVHGNGPEIRSVLPANNRVSGNTSNTQKLDLQIDYTIHSGLAISEADKLFVISGGTPAGIGQNPSPGRTEILWFEDRCPADRRGDYTDFRANGLPNPPQSGGNSGDGDSDRFDHIFLQAPIDGVTFTPTGFSGLARGFLLYLNRTRNDPMNPLAPLPNGTTQGDDAFNGPISFEEFDPSHQVAGGDDQNTPFRGDDSDGLGSPVLSLNPPRVGGFEFVFGGPVGIPACVWNGFFLNSNGNITFGAGDMVAVPDVLSFRTGLPKIAPAWTDLNPASRAGGFLNTFPVQALGFADINGFKVRWINVPEFGLEICGSQNTFSLLLKDDGTGVDENSSQPFNPANPIGNNSVPFDQQEGPTDSLHVLEPVSNTIVPCPPRRNSTGQFCFEYGRMDLLGTAVRPVLVGYSIGDLNPLNPPGLCELNLGEAARAADAGTFGVIQGTTAVISPCLIGEGTEPTLYEFFNEGKDAMIGAVGEVTYAVPDFDLRGEGNDAPLCTSFRQRDLNRGRVCFYGLSCLPPPNATCFAVKPKLPVLVAPNQPQVDPINAQGIVNALCGVGLNIAGCGFFPNEVTIVCQGFPPASEPLERPGKTVTTAISLSCDTNGDGIPDSVVPLGNIMPTNENLIMATLQPLAQFPGTAFPLACCGGPGVLTMTTTFTAGDNNVFGPFTRTTTCSLNLGTRAPVVLSVIPSGGDCSIAQDVLIAGACFIIPNQGPVTRVFAVEFNPATQMLNPANTIDATNFVVLNANLIDAFFNFGGANAGKTFMIFVTGPGGTSRNLTQGETPPGCVFGNEQGIQVTFTCTGGGPPPPPPSETVVTIVATDPSAREGGDTGRFCVTRTGPTGSPLVVNYTLGGTATQGSDYNNLPGSVTIPGGASTACFTVTPKNDTYVECPETVIATLAAGAGYAIGVPSNATVTIHDINLPKVTIVATDGNASEPGSNTGTFTLTRTGCTSAPLTVKLNVGGTATPGSDYTPFVLPVVFGAGNSTATLVVQPANDNIHENLEWVLVTVAADPWYTVGNPSTAFVTIADND